MPLFEHQTKALERTARFNRCAYYHDMGLGKTYTGAEKMVQIGNKVNLVICQKSKIQDWVEHFVDNYELSEHMMIYDVTKWKKSDWVEFKNDPTFSADWHNAKVYVLICNYELAWRRKQLLQLHDFTLMLDESSLIQNETAKQTKFIMNIHPSNIILLSGTPTSGKYENLWTQAQLLGWNISKEKYNATYINWTLTPDDGSGIRHKIVDKDNPYKNVDRLKAKLRQYGADFLKTEDVVDLPEQTFIPVMVDAPGTYKKFVEDDYVCITWEDTDGEPTPIELIGTTTFTKRLYKRQLCSQYNKNKIDALADLIQSTSDRLIIFYNFNDELDILKGVCDAQNRPYSEVNGSVKDLTNYEEKVDSVTLIQYQAGARGLNLQKCNKTIYFSLPDMSELFEQSKKRTHRIGQLQPCFYYLMMARNTIDEQMKAALDMRKDLTDYLFEEGE